MANYENGAFTRQAIVRACMKLFYEKGYHETSYSDICKEAHVNRSTIYYHFKDKDAMRYEVMWEYTISNKRIAEKYCDKPEYHFILAVCLLWHQIKLDEKIRRFIMTGQEDYPVLTGKMDFTYYYVVLFESMWGSFFDKKGIPEVAFSSVYGYVTGCMRMLADEPERYEAIDLFQHCVNSCMSIWKMDMAIMDTIWKEFLFYYSQIPEKEKMLVIE